MENIMMPSNYLVLNDEEMTYTEGGATAVQALCAWIVPFYGWWKGVTAVRDWRREHPDDWVSSGLEHLTDDMQKSTANLFYDIACSIIVVNTTVSLIGLPLNACIIFSK